MSASITAFSEYLTAEAGGAAFSRFLMYSWSVFSSDAELFFGAAFVFAQRAAFSPCLRQVAPELNADGGDESECSHFREPAGDYRLKFRVYPVKEDGGGEEYVGAEPYPRRSRLL